MLVQRLRERKKREIYYALNHSFLKMERVSAVSANLYNASVNDISVYGYCVYFVAMVAFPDLGCGCRRIWCPSHAGLPQWGRTSLSQCRPCYLWCQAWPLSQMAFAHRLKEWRGWGFTYTHTCTHTLAKSLVPLWAEILLALMGKAHWPVISPFWIVNGMTKSKGRSPATSKPFMPIGLSVACSRGWGEQ